MTNEESRFIGIWALGLLWDLGFGASIGVSLKVAPQMSNCFCVFLKAPRPGHVKTRLAATIGAKRAAELYRAFLLDTLAWVSRLSGCDRRVEYTPRQDEALCRTLLPRGGGFSFHPQVDGDLGERLRATFSAMFAAGHQRCVVIGTDCPTLGPREARLAFRALESTDVVLGPTLDGGYYLVGLRRPAPELFESIPWSTDRVLGLTLERAAAAGLVTRALRTLSDVDSASDLAPLYRELVSRWRERQHSFPVWTFRTLEWRMPGYHGRPR